MGGHTLVGEYWTLAELWDTLEKAVDYYFNEYNLYFEFAAIVYNSETKKFELTAHFTK